MEPTTKAGQRLMAQTLGLRNKPEDIVAIEDEAKAQERKRLRAVVVDVLGWAEWEDLIAPQLADPEPAK